MADDIKINNKTLMANKGGIDNPIVPKVSSRRDVILWRAPGIGYVEMYINPQQMQISNSKIAQSTRTKAGYIYQYAGEALTNITISGTTGSSGIEGINLLEKVYRSEQLTFAGIAEQLDASAQAAPGMQQFTSMLAGFAGLGQFGASQDFASFLGSAMLPDIYNQPFPTLASLAAAVEMHHQGVIYRGFFDSFSFTESAQYPGIFEYDIKFSAYSRVGERYNFMPWHRLPEGQSDSNSQSNYSFLKVQVDGEVKHLREEQQSVQQSAQVEILPGAADRAADQEFIRNSSAVPRTLTGNGLDLRIR